MSKHFLYIYRNLQAKAESCQTIRKQAGFPENGYFDPVSVVAINVRRRNGILWWRWIDGECKAPERPPETEAQVRSEAMDDIEPGAGLPDLEFLPISCPECGRKANSARDEADPRAAVRAEILCPDCVVGVYGTTTYFDAQDRELLLDPDESEEAN
ncbi:hypothetical protein KUV57_11035 [Epibacterium sp. DP7N7-1]|nr:hypothetical protein [Epibacterium sp. DP7N7-1]